MHLNILIIKSGTDSKHVEADVQGIPAIPACVFELSRVHGDGTYIAHIEGEGPEEDGPTFLLTTSWLGS